MVRNGNRVVFDTSGSYIEKQDGGFVEDDGGTARKRTEE